MVSTSKHSTLQLSTLPNSFQAKVTARRTTLLRDVSAWPRWLPCLTQEQYVAGITPFTGGYRPTFFSVDPARLKNSRPPRQRRRADCRLQTPLAQIMMRATVPTLIVYPSQWIAARLGRTCNGSEGANAAHAGRPCPQRRIAFHTACCICRTRQLTRGWLAKSDRSSS